MLELRSCKKEEHSSAVLLTKTIFKDNMDKQFLLLLGIDNIDRMFVASDNLKVVSMVNYYPASVRLGLMNTKVASVGAVCTLESYRHQFLASKLLQMSQKKMLKEAVRIVIISGDSGLYKRFGSNVVGNVIGYKVRRNDLKIDGSISIREYTGFDFEAIYQIYVKEDIKFERTKEEFKKLIQGQTTPDTFADYPFFLIYEHNILKSYLIVNRPFKKRSLLAKEYAGNRHVLAKAIPSVLASLKKVNLSIVCDPVDLLNNELKSNRHIRTDLHASIKIIDFLGLMKDLESHIKDKCSITQVQNLKYSQKDDIFIFSYLLEKQVSLTVFELNQLVFGPNSGIIRKVPSKELKDIFKKIFPIPFVWVHNLNYQ